MLKYLVTVGYFGQWLGIDFCEKKSLTPTAEWAVIVAAE